MWGVGGRLSHIAAFYWVWAAMQLAAKEGGRRPAVTHYRLLLGVGGQLAAQELLYVREGGAVGRLPAPAFEHELDQIPRLLQLLRGAGQHLQGFILRLGGTYRAAPAGAHSQIRGYLQGSTCRGSFSD